MPHPNQYTKNPRGLGEYCPRYVVRVSETQDSALRSGAKAAGLPVATYLRCCAFLEPWPAESTVPPWINGDMTRLRKINKAVK